MHVIIMGIMDAISNVLIDARGSAKCKRMLAEPLQGNIDGMHGDVGGGHGGYHILTRRFPKKTRTNNIGCGARTSYSHGKRSRGGKHEEEGFESESD